MFRSWTLHKTVVHMLKALSFNNRSPYILLSFSNYLFLSNTICYLRITKLMQNSTLFHMLLLVLWLSVRQVSWKYFSFWKGMNLILSVFCVSEFLLICHNGAWRRVDLNGMNIIHAVYNFFISNFSSFLFFFNFIFIFSLSDQHQITWSITTYWWLKIKIVFLKLLNKSLKKNAS